MSIYRMATVDVPIYEETASDSYTKLLLHCDGTNGSTVITDKIGKAMTAYGNAKISTAQSKFRGASLSLDGNGDYISSLIVLTSDLAQEILPLIFGSIQMLHGVPSLPVLQFVGRRKVILQMDGCFIRMVAIQLKLMRGWV